MKIKLKKKRLYNNLFLGLLWLLLGVSYFIFDTTIPWIGYLHLILSLLDFVNFSYSLKQGYLKIENGWIQKNIFYSFRNKIKIDEIDTIKRIGGNYILKSRKRDLKINPDLIDQDSLKELNILMIEWGLPPEKVVLKA